MPNVITNDNIDHILNTNKMDAHLSILAFHKFLKIWEQTTLNYSKHKTLKSFTASECVWDSLTHLMHNTTIQMEQTTYVGVSTTPSFVEGVENDRERDYYVSTPQSEPTLNFLNLGTIMETTVCLHVLRILRYEWHLTNGDQITRI